MFVLLEKRSRDVASFSGEYKGLVFPGRTFLFALNPAGCHRASLPGTPTRLARGMSGFLIGQIEKKLHDVSFRIDPQGSVCTGCRTGCRVSARVDCLCTRHRLE